MRIIRLLFVLTALLVCTKSAEAQGPFVYDYLCWQAGCSDYSGPSFVVWAEVDMIGFCDNWTTPQAGSSVFAACTEFMVTGYAWGFVENYAGPVGFIQTISGFVETFESGYSRTDCYYSHYESPVFGGPC